MTRSSNRSVRLSVAGLERRDTPAAGVSLSGHVLVVTGDAAANDVQITVDDAADDIKVVADGVTSHVAAHLVSAINANLKDGNDALVVQLGDPGAASAHLTRALTVIANLGAGDDSAFYTFGGLGLPGREVDAGLRIYTHAGDGNDSVTGNFGKVQAATVYQTFLGNGDDDGFAGVWGNVNSQLFIDLRGEAGNDSLNTFATYQNGSYDNVNIGSGGLLSVSMSGGVGDDTLNTTYGGLNRGLLRVREDGDAGNDQVTADLHLQKPPIFPIPTGAVDAVLTGGAGKDQLKLTVEGPAVRLRALIDGGAGIDTATGTPNVKIINANEVLKTL